MLRTTRGIFSGEMAERTKIWKRRECTVVHRHAPQCSNPTHREHTGDETQGEAQRKMAGRTKIWKRRECTVHPAPADTWTYAHLHSWCKVGLRGRGSQVGHQGAEARGSGMT